MRVVLEVTSVKKLLFLERLFCYKILQVYSKAFLVRVVLEVTSVKKLLFLCVAAKLLNVNILAMK